MKFTVKMNRKDYTITENDRIMFNGACYILISQKTRCGYGYGEPTVPKKYAEKWIKDGILVEFGLYKSAFDDDFFPLYKFVKEVE